VDRRKTGRRDDGAYNVVCRGRSIKCNIVSYVFHKTSCGERKARRFTVFWVFIMLVLTLYFTIPMLHIYVRMYLFPTNCLSVDQHVYDYFSDMFRLLMIASLGDIVDTKGRILY
jgi:hypothetical protein